MKPDRKAPLPLLTPAPARRKRWGKWLLIGVVIYSLIGFLILPAIIKWQLRKQLPALTHRQVKLDQVRMNPYTLSLTVRGLALTETNGTPFAAFDELYVNFQLSSLFRWTWTFGEIRLTHPTANLIRFADGSFNFSNLAGAPNTNPPAPPPPILIQSLLVTNTIVTVMDRNTPQTFRAAYGPINIALTDFTTRPAKDGPYSFVATTEDGETFAWSGRFSINPVRSTGKFRLSGIAPAKYSPYVAQFTTVLVQRGRLELAASYRVNAARMPVELELTNATAELRDLLIKTPEGDITLLAIDRFRVANTSVSLTGHVAQVGTVMLNGGEAFLKREPDGQPRLLKYLITSTNQPALTTTPGTNSVVPPTPWRFQLDELSLTNFQVSFEDHSTLGVAELGLDNLTLNLKGLSNQTNTPIDLAVGFNWRGGGSEHTVTRGTLMPLDLTTAVLISNLAIAPVQPYLGQHLNLVVHSGELNVQGAVRFNPAGTPQFHFTGDAGITNFSSSDTVTYHELAAWENHLVRGVDLTLQPNRLTIEEIKFIGARNSLVISSNGQVNVAALAKLSPVTNDVAAVAVTNAEPQEPFPIRVGLITLERNSFRLADDSLLRRSETHVEEINGSISNIALPGLNKASVNIHGKVSALAPFEIVGEVTPDPDNLFVDLKVAFTNTDLTSLSPYMEKFVGRPLTKGKLTTELRYHIENRSLTAANLVNLDKLTLGGRVESPDATKLPVKLAIGLLKDSDGRIALDLPITGSLDDPTFSIRGLVGKAFKNIILKVATSPFSLLSALVGGSEELQFVEFDPGLTALNDSQTNKLMKLAEALTKRPALELEIGATFDPIKDVDVLGRQKVAQQMKVSRIEEIVARGKPAPALETMVLEDNEYDRLLRKAYRAAFNTTPEQALQDTLLASIATNAPGTINITSPATPATSQPAKGGELLARRGKTLTQLAAQNQPTSAANSNTAAQPQTERELIRNELETRLATTTPVTANELRALMQLRIETVQKFMVESASIAGDRVLPTTPNPEDPTAGGPPGSSSRSIKTSARPPSFDSQPAAVNCILTPA